LKIENTRFIFLAGACLLICLGGGSCKKKPGPESVPEGNPGNLHVRVRNTGSRTISNVLLEIGEKESKACELAPSAETEHVFYRYPVIEPLLLSYQDDKGSKHMSAIGELYKKMPETIKGNFDVTFYINSNTDEVVILTTDEE
jgi:hypothetical protein